MGTFGEAFNEAVAAELRAERGRKKVTIEQLVKEAGLSRSAVLNYLNGKRDIPTPALVEISRALDVDPRLIFERAQVTVKEL